MGVITCESSASPVKPRLLWVADKGGVMESGQLESMKVSDTVLVQQVDGLRQKAHASKLNSLRAAWLHVLLTWRRVAARPIALELEQSNRACKLQPPTQDSTRLTLAPTAQK